MAKHPDTIAGLYYETMLLCREAARRAVKAYGLEHRFSKEALKEYRSALNDLERAMAAKESPSIKDKISMPE